ncbi:uncharacterized protein GGS22DRAFT_175979 [Annulohypoxylon maeteangense]|uniref:uncharacterized protein n=1 Tax=Annulohypoxylon maeteangense TaxID=1927788 RepID=UPI002008C258|nr:uncharacterized protein GGS22DRAFT_175979 [Annulohypoxylon maeteangense]KAI0880143.1 hypothetical protein GGS22DRAFT_175979 [Annulohypoxylon maeteangense]
MASNGQVDGSARAVQYLNQADVGSEVVQRPKINVPVDVSYNLDRFLNPHLHAEDRYLRPLQSPAPLTEEESRMRMTAILNSMTLDLLSKQN